MTATPQPPDHHIANALQRKTDKQRDRIAQLEAECANHKRDKADMSLRLRNIGAHVDRADPLNVRGPRLTVKEPIPVPAWMRDQDDDL